MTNPRRRGETETATPGETGIPSISSHVPSRSRFHFLADDQIESLPRPAWLVDEMIPVSGLGVVYAPPESLKTFYMLALAFSVAYGIPFFGRETRKGSVIYVAAEGSAGLPVRVTAWKHSAERFGRAGVHFLTEPVQLLEGGDVSTFLAALDTLGVAPALIIFDTLGLCMSGGDEGTRDMGLAVHAAGMIRRATKAAVILVHHTRLDGERERGSTVLRATADVMMALKREGDSLTVSCEKQKDAPHFPLFTLELISVQDSCTLLTARSGSAVSALFPADPRHKALTILHESSLADGLSTSAWLKASEMKERTFYKARKQLIAGGYVDAPAKKGGPNRVTPTGEEAI